MSDYPNIDAMLERFKNEVAGKPLAEQIAYCYELPIGQAHGIVAMVASKVAAEREECAKLCDAAFNDDRHGLDACDLAGHLANVIRLRTQR
jgi:hypothetical protein